MRKITFKEDKPLLNLNEILAYFPRRVAGEINKTISQNRVNEEINLLEEIRIRASKPVILKYTNSGLVYQFYNLIPILNVEENTVYNTLIISPPGVRKNNDVKRFS